jgi:hypothetical protein
MRPLLNRRWFSFQNVIKKTNINSGLFQSLLPDFPMENQLLNKIFYYFCKDLIVKRIYSKQIQHAITEKIL